MEIYEMAGHLIRRLHQTSVHVFQQGVKEAGLDLTPVQFAAMSTVHEDPGIDQATIASRIAYDRATIGGVIDRLEQKGWVRRLTRKRDRRAREVRLTEEGLKIFQAALPVVRAVQVEILPGLSEEEQQAFLKLARKATGPVDVG